MDVLAITLLALYGVFLFWYGGRGKPLRQHEIDAFIGQFDALPAATQQPELRASLQALMAQDDGREFVMQNLARYRAKALYPPGRDFGDDPRAADRRYGRAIVPQLLRRGSLPIFIARRTGSFIEPAGMPAWDYVAMVRYRSRRDFVRFALAIERADIAMHKWAALEQTHVFPVRPLVSLVCVRIAVAALLLAIWMLAQWAVA